MEEKEKNTDGGHEIMRRWGLWNFDRPLPARGCSWAFYLFLLALTAFLVVMYLFYKKG